MKWTLLAIGLVALLAGGCEGVVQEVPQITPVVTERIVTHTNDQGQISISLEKTTNMVTHLVAAPTPAAEQVIGMGQTGLLGPKGEIAAGAAVLGIAAWNLFRRKKAAKN